MKVLKVITIAAALSAVTGAAMADSSVVHEKWAFDGKQLIPSGVRAEVVVSILKSLANTDRLLILCHLSQQELNVSQIEEITDIKQPTLSQQLMMLRKSDVVNTRRDGKQIYYSMANSNMRCDSLKSLMIINKLSKFL